MHVGSCHCAANPSVHSGGGDRLQLLLCRRIGGPWIYFEFGTVEIQGHPAATWGPIRALMTLRGFAVPRPNFLWSQTSQ